MSKKMDAYLIFRSIASGENAGKWYVSNAISLSREVAERRTRYVPDSEARVVRVRIEIPEDVRGKLVSDDVYMPYI